MREVIVSQRSFLYLVSESGITFPERSRGVDLTSKQIRSRANKLCPTFKAPARSDALSPYRRRISRPTRKHPLAVSRSLVSSFHRWIRMRRICYARCRSQSTIETQFPRWRVATRARGFLARYSSRFLLVSLNDKNRVFCGTNRSRNEFQKIESRHIVTSGS